MLMVLPDVAIVTIPVPDSEEVPGMLAVITPELRPKLTLLLLANVMAENVPDEAPAEIVM